VKRCARVGADALDRPSGARQGGGGGSLGAGKRGLDARCALAQPVNLGPNVGKVIDKVLLLHDSLWFLVCSCHPCAEVVNDPSAPADFPPAFECRPQKKFHIQGLAAYSSNGVANGA